MLCIPFAPILVSHIENERSMGGTYQDDPGFRSQVSFLRLLTLHNTTSLASLSLRGVDLQTTHARRRIIHERGVFCFLLVGLFVHRGGRPERAYFVLKRIVFVFAASDK